MKIHSIKLTETEKLFTVAVSFKNKDFNLSFKTIDGKVYGNYENGVATDYITYFNKTSRSVRQGHFNIIKKLIESKYKNLHAYRLAWCKFMGQITDVSKDAISDSQPQGMPSFGEQLVGINFNPSADSKVDKAKRLCADLMDLVEGEITGSETSKLRNTLYNHTIGEILNAQMNCVKLLTLKY